MSIRLVAETVVHPGAARGSAETPDPPLLEFLWADCGAQKDCEKRQTFPPKCSSVPSQEADSVQNGHRGCVPASSEISAGESAYDLAASDNVDNLHSELEFEWYIGHTFVHCQMPQAQENSRNVKPEP